MRNGHALRPPIAALALGFYTVAVASECTTDDAKMDAIDALIQETSQDRWYGMLLSTMGEDTFEVIACSKDEDKCCDAVIEVTNKCQITTVILEGRCEYPNEAFAGTIHD